jgi:hypothetical protein
MKSALENPKNTGEEDPKYVPTGLDAVTVPSSKDASLEASESDRTENQTKEQADEQPTDTLKAPAEDSAKTTPKSEQIEIGMTPDKVKSILGTPTQSSKWLDSDGTTLIGQLVYVTASEKIYIKLRNGKVQSIQQEALKH